MSDEKTTPYKKVRDVLANYKSELHSIKKLDFGIELVGIIKIAVVVVKDGKEYSIGLEYGLGVFLSEQSDTIYRLIEIDIEKIIKDSQS